MTGKEVEAKVVGSEAQRVIIVAARWNEFFGESMIQGAKRALVRHGVLARNILLVRCPGCFELPMVAERAIAAHKPDAVICLGILIRGATPHFDYIASATTSGIARVALEQKTPVGFGVLTCDTLEQTMERSGSKAGNKGEEAALATLEMMNLYNEIKAVTF